MPLEVIGAGHGRTGTTSLKEALEILGFPCCNMVSIEEKHPDHMSCWIQAYSNRPDWDSLFQDYQAGVDWPLSTFYKELLIQYPNAKVVYTERNFDSWYSSIMETIYQAKLLLSQAPGYVRPFSVLNSNHGKVLDLLFEKEFGPNFEDKEYVRKKYAEYAAAVKAYVPKDQLLVYHVKEGWEPLCKFLDRPVPSAPFPNVNNTEDFKKRLGRLRREIKVLTFAIPILSALAGGGIAVCIGALAKKVLAKK